MRKLLIALLVLVSIFAFVSCDDSKNVPDEITVSTWDGTIDTTWYKEDTKEFTLTEASQLAGLAQLVNAGNDFEGKTINLGNNINLNDKQWTPIGLYKDDEGNSVKKEFSGTFDGKDYVITGLKIICENASSSYRALFGYADKVVKNFTVKGEVKACDSSGVVAALGDGGTIENVTSYVNVTVDKKTIGDKPNQAKVAGIVVAVKASDSKIGCTIKNCKNYGKITSTADGSTDCIGGILSIAWDGVDKLKIQNCTNEGEVSTASSKQYAGGIVGDLSGKTTNTLIENCTNKGSVTAPTGEESGAGTIIGKIFDGATGQIVNCTPSDSDTIKQVGKGSFSAVSTTADSAQST